MLEKQGCEAERYAERFKAGIDQNIRDDRKKYKRDPVTSFRI